MPLPPGFVEDTPVVSPSATGGTPPKGFIEDSTNPDFGQVVKDALNEAHMGNGSKLRDLMIDPITQAKALPYLTGTAGAVSGIPGGTTLGTVGGRQISNEALRLYNRPDLIPSTGSQVKEGLLSAAGDVTAIPAINRKIFGSAVGQAERGAGMPDPFKNPEAYPSLPRPGGPAPVTNSIDEAVKMLSDPTVEKSPVFFKRLQDQIKWLYSLGKDQKLSDLDKIKLASLSDTAQNGLNASISGRAGPAASLAMSQTIPNAISKVTRSVPWWAKAALLAGATGTGLEKALSGVGVNLGH